MVKNEFYDSKSYLNKAKKTFEANKMKRTVGEINKKLKILKNMKEREAYEQEVTDDGEEDE